MAFTILNLADPILRALKEEGYTVPTPIQAKAIPPILEGRDVLGCAQTGTGKTAAFALPILHRLLTAPIDKTRRGPAFPRALILSPTRELATQIGESFATYGRHTGLVHTCIYGGVSQYHQVRALHRGVDILVATPGRLEDLMEQRVVNLSEVRVLILDEADRMLDMGFIQPIRRIAAALPNTPQTPRHTLLFSATMPKEIMHLADSLLKNPVKVAVAAAPSAIPLITQSLYMVSKNDKQTLLHHLINDKSVQRAVVFTKTKFGADRVSRKLKQAGIKADEIHGNKAQNQRQRALDAFRAGRTRVLVATDVAARGLDVDAITHVFNFDMPMEPESYVHRIGRTGRAGATGLAVSFCDKSERGLLRDVERLTGKPIPTLPLPQGMERVDGSPDPIDSFNNTNAKRAPSANAERAGNDRSRRQSNDQGRGQERWGDSGARTQARTAPQRAASSHATTHAPAPSHAKRDHHPAKVSEKPAHTPTSAPKPAAPSAPKHTPAPAPRAHAEPSHAPRTHRMPMTDPIVERPEKNYDYSRIITEKPAAPRQTGDAGFRPARTPAPAHRNEPRPADRNDRGARDSGPGFKKPFAKSGKPPFPAARGDRPAFAARDDRRDSRDDRGTPRHRDDSRDSGNRFGGPRSDSGRFGSRQAGASAPRAPWSKSVPGTGAGKPVGRPSVSTGGKPPMREGAAAKPFAKPFAKKAAAPSDHANAHPLARPKPSAKSTHPHAAPSKGKPAPAKKSNKKPHRKGAAPARPFAEGKAPGHKKSRA